MLIWESANYEGVIFIKVQVIYSSLTGCTKRAAKTIYDNLKTTDKSIHNLKDGAPVLDGDIILLGYWGMIGGPSKDVKAFLETIKGKAVGVFCTLGYYAESIHAFDTLKTGVDILKDNNEIIGSYVCNGAVANELIENQVKDLSKLPTEQKEIRWEITNSHPTEAECKLASERFNERIYLYEKCKKLNIPFQSII